MAANGKEVHTESPCVPQGQSIVMPYGTARSSCNSVATNVSPCTLPARGLKCPNSTATKLQLREKHGKHLSFYDPISYRGHVV